MSAETSTPPVRVVWLNRERARKAVDHLRQHFSGLTLCEDHPIVVEAKEDGTIEAWFTAISQTNHAMEAKITATARFDPDEFFPLLDEKKVLQ
ncbi:MAG: hypothetical protein SO360_01935 [Bifidobacterium tsurumiense]|uniref:hypothetical protein n=1 Tax=Bifidobacterium tsurumiense TaxID=356829 RepID=UPI002A8109D4|nr:hypothetical protein [Bifidobacterium tsurumiense]MDY4677613.1 hypothetical protein [Bifidobacterium tsurumiense]